MTLGHNTRGCVKILAHPLVVMRAPSHVQKKRAQLLVQYKIIVYFCSLYTNIHRIISIIRAADDDKQLLPYQY